MRECNKCMADCKPIGARLMSNKPCNRSLKDSFRWNFSDLVSRITVKNPDSYIIQMLQNT